MASKPKKQGDLDEAPGRQLGLGLLFVPRTDVLVVAPPPPVVVATAPLPLAPPVSLAPLPLAPPVPPVDEAPRPPRVFSVGELVRAARLTLESRFSEARVTGEVSGFKRSGPGHLYFCLKDDQASLDCVMYSREATRLRFAIEDGMAVRLRGRLTIYEGRGRFQMTVVEIEPQGAGALAVAFEQLKKKLEAAGLFAAARKRRLPFLPRRLGVVTSPQGAVIQDIIRVAHRRFPVPILLAPTPVQGPGAVAGIVQGLQQLARVPDVDVIIVARGGGSIEDLWSFNEEEVARAIAACPVPVISAVGHETDFTIADFVADVRAPTPSAAAELAVPVLSDLRTELSTLMNRATRGTGAHLRQARLILERAQGRVADPRRLFDERRQVIDDLGGRAQRLLGRRLARYRSDLVLAEVALSRAHPHRRIATQRATLAGLAQTLETVGRRLVQRRRGPLDSLGHKLDALSPRRVLDRGYSLAFGADGHLLTDAAGARVADPIRVVLKTGELTATVTATAPGGGEGSDAAAPPPPPHRRRRRGQDRFVIHAAVLGSDVSMSRSPAIHNAAYRAMGVDGRFEALSVDVAGFDALVAQLGGRGYRYVNVTIPHKGAAAAQATTRSAMVRNCGAANTLIFEPGRPTAIHAENTDGHGLLAALADLGADAGGQDAVVVGAGGAAAGAIEALTAAGARVRVVARRLDAAQALVDHIPAQRRKLARAFAWGDGGLANALEGARILVSSVPAAAWADAEASAPLTTIERDTAVLEMAYGAPGSALARAVRGRVARYADGLGMLVHQAARAIELALGESPPLAPLFVAARVANL